MSYSRKASPTYAALRALRDLAGAEGLALIEDVGDAVTAHRLCALAAWAVVVGRDPLSRYSAHFAAMAFVEELESARARRRPGGTSRVREVH